MSDEQPQAEEKLKAGHAPAVKVGGMRVAHVTTATHKEVPEEKEDMKIAEKDKNLNVSGYISQGNKDFTETAVKVAHDKPPIPRKEHVQESKNDYFAKNFHINQPRGNNF